LHLVAELRGRLLGARIIVIDSQGYLITQRAIVSGAKLLCTSAEDLLDFLTLGITHWQPGAQPAERAVDHSLARAEWGHIRRVLDDCGGNVTEAARLLGIHRRSLQRKLRKNPPHG
jgi:two-component system response regulator RegA